MYKIITISRQYGSGGREIGRRIAERLGIPFYDKEIIEQASNTSTIDKSFFEKAETSGVGSLFYKLSESLAADVRHDISLDAKVYLAQRAVLQEIARKGPCVIVGRGACEVLKGEFPLLRTYIYADMDTRIKRAIEEYHESAENIEKRIHQIDKKRKAYYSFYEKKENDLTKHFDLCINSGEFGIERTARFIANMYRG